MNILARYYKRKLRKSIKIIRDLLKEKGVMENDARNRIICKTLNLNYETLLTIMEEDYEKQP